METEELKPFRQTWLSDHLLHSSPSAEIVIIDGDQWASLEHPRGGPLGCVKNRTGKKASGVQKIDGRWCWVIGDQKGEKK